MKISINFLNLQLRNYQDIVSFLPEVRNEHHKMKFKCSLLKAQLICFMDKPENMFIL